MATDSNAEERLAFIDKLAESANLDEWVEAYFGDDIEDVAGMDSLTADVALHDAAGLTYHWQRREVYNAFTEEVWAAIWSAADEDKERSPLSWLVACEDDTEIDTHQRFIDIMVIRALGIVARDIVGGNE